MQGTSKARRNRWRSERRRRFDRHNDVGYNAGTRVRLFPQTPIGDDAAEPETVWLSTPAGSLQAGPADDRMYVIDPLDKPIPYGSNAAAPGDPPLFQIPPWRGPLASSARPNADGHLDHIPLDTAAFEAAHVYGAVRYVLDIWEGYLGGPIPWHFRRDHERLEIVLLRHFDNATAGYGYMEIGSATTEDGRNSPFSLNFDLIAHEVGHLLIFSLLGLPDLDRADGEYYAFHESTADIISLISSLHFNSVVDDLLDQTSGNLYTYNQLARFAELSTYEQIRLANNRERMQDYAQGWHKEHHLAQPLTGAMFDSLVDIFHEQLLDRGLISEPAEDLADRLQRDDQAQDQIQAIFDDAYGQDPHGFKDALLQARDEAALGLAATWQSLEVDGLSFEGVGRKLLHVDQELTGGRYQRLIANNLHWRQIGEISAGPRLAPPDEDSHVFSPRTQCPDEHGLF